MEANLGNAPRKKLADISNLPRQTRVSSHDNKLENIPLASKEYVDKLQKENVALMKMLAERNKIIEITGTEIQELRTNLQKMQQQNRQLAQSNSQMLVELNLDKDRLKKLNHELGCRNGLLKARDFDAEEKANTQIGIKLDDEVKPIKCADAGDLSMVNGDDERAGNLKRRPRSKSLGFFKQVQSEYGAENKRNCLRRQSAQFKPEVLEHDDAIFEVEDKCSLRLPTNNSVQENGSTSISISFKDLECNPALRFETRQFGRSSMSRPSREAAKKVQSYKEIPVNIKMRRPE